LIDDPLSPNQSEDPYVAELVRLVKLYKPRSSLPGRLRSEGRFSPGCRDIEKPALTADCTGLDIDTEKNLLRQTRPPSAAMFMATIICPSRRPQMSTVRPARFQKEINDGSPPENIIKRSILIKCL